MQKCSRAQPSCSPERLLVGPEPGQTAALIGIEPSLLRLVVQLHWLWLTILLSLLLSLLPAVPSVSRVGLLLLLLL